MFVSNPKNKSLGQMKGVGVQEVVRDSYGVGLWKAIGFNVAKDKIWNIGKNGYIGIWILRIYQKYW